MTLADKETAGNNGQEIITKLEEMWVDIKTVWECFYFHGIPVSKWELNRIFNMMNDWEKSFRLVETLRTKRGLNEILTMTINDQVKTLASIWVDIGILEWKIVFCWMEIDENMLTELCIKGAEWYDAKHINISREPWEIGLDVDA